MLNGVTNGGLFTGMIFVRKIVQLPEMESKQALLCYEGSQRKKSLYTEKTSYFLYELTNDVTCTVPRYYTRTHYIIV